MSDDRIARANRRRPSTRARVLARAFARARVDVVDETLARGDAERTVREMYERINARDVDGALACVDENVVYEDFNFPAPFRGKAAVKKLFEESCEGIPDDLTFVILSLIHI